MKRLAILQLIGFIFIVFCGICQCNNDKYPDAKFWDNIIKGVGHSGTQTDPVNVTNVDTNPPMTTTMHPSKVPTNNPTPTPTQSPTNRPTMNPTMSPTVSAIATSSQGVGYGLFITYQTISIILAGITIIALWNIDCISNGLAVYLTINSGIFGFSFVFIFVFQIQTVACNKNFYNRHQFWLFSFMLITPCTFFCIFLFCSIFLCIAMLIAICFVQFVVAVHWKDNHSLKFLVSPSLTCLYVYLILFCIRSAVSCVVQFWYCHHVMSAHYMNQGLVRLHTIAHFARVSSDSETSTSSLADICCKFRLSNIKKCFQNFWMNRLYFTLTLLALLLTILFPLQKLVVDHAHDKFEVEDDSDNFKQLEPIFELIKDEGKYINYFILPNCVVLALSCIFWAIALPTTVSMFDDTNNDNNNIDNNNNHNSINNNCNDTSIKVTLDTNKDPIGEYCDDDKNKISNNNDNNNHKYLQGNILLKRLGLSFILCQTLVIVTLTISPQQTTESTRTAIDVMRHCALFSHIVCDFALVLYFKFMSRSTTSSKLSASSLSSMNQYNLQTGGTSDVKNLDICIIAPQKAVTENNDSELSQLVFTDGMRKIQRTLEGRNWKSCMGVKKGLDTIAENKCHKYKIKECTEMGHSFSSSGSQSFNSLFILRLTDMLPQQKNNGSNTNISNRVRKM